MKTELWPVYRTKPSAGLPDSLCAVVGLSRGSTLALGSVGVTSFLDEFCNRIGIRLMDIQVGELDLIEVDRPTYTQIHHGARSTFLPRISVKLSNSLLKTRRCLVGCQGLGGLISPVLHGRFRRWCIAHGASPNPFSHVPCVGGIILRDVRKTAAETREGSALCPEVFRASSTLG